MINKIKYFLSPAFLEKDSILKSIKYIIKLKEGELKGKSVLDIGCGNQPYKSLFDKAGADYKGIDFKDYSLNNSFKLLKPSCYFSNDYRNNLKLSIFKNKSFDWITSFQVLEHHEKPEIFFSEASRLLKKEGYLLITFPFIWSLHEEPFDYQRLTHHKIEKLAKENNFKIVKIIKRGGTFSTISQILNTSLFSMGICSFLKWLLYITLLLPFQYLVYLFELISNNKNKKVFLGYLMLLQKVNK